MSCSTLPALTMPVQHGVKFRHNKTGREYTVIATGLLESDLSPVVIYKNAQGQVWVRPHAEFNDGRFTCID